MPPAGIALVVGFFVILAVCLYWDKSTSKRFQKKISQEYQAQESFGDFFVTANGELLCYLPSGTLAGYKKWNLSDIACICTDGGSFVLMDSNQKPMPGEYLTPSKKPVLEKAAVNFAVGSKNIGQFVDFIQKYGPHIQHTISGKRND